MLILQKITTQVGQVAKTTANSPPAVCQKHLQTELLNDVMNIRDIFSGWLLRSRCMQKLLGYLDM